MRHKRIYQGVNYVEVNGTTAEDLYNRNIEILVVRESNTSCYDYLRVKKHICEPFTFDNFRDIYYIAVETFNKLFE